MYDLSEQLASFNFFDWLVQVKGRGFKRVVFDISAPRVDKWLPELTAERFWSICYPGPALGGLGVEVINDPHNPGTGLETIPTVGLVSYFKSGSPFYRLGSPLPPIKSKYTVTLRKHHPQDERGRGQSYRDSDESVWRDFAEEIGAVVIEDYNTKPIHLHKRFAMYAGSEMNFFVQNGPGMICTLTNFQCMVFNIYQSRKYLIGEGVEDGGQYPWMLHNQRLIWEEATAESLRRHFYHWRETKTFAQDSYAPQA